MIYLDNAATTKLNKEVLSSYIQLLENYFLNADSPYQDAIDINNLQEKARNLLAEMMKVQSDELIFTSGGCEANTTAIKGVAYKYLNRKQKHIITSLIEHSSIYETMKLLESQGYEITYLKPDKFGFISNDDIINSIKDETILISIMKINGELGSINNIESIYNEIKEINPQIIVHSDCVQALGKYDIDLSKLDLASFSAHKINGLKGSGLLYKKNNVNIIPLIHGGQQESGVRGGTSNYATNIVFSKTLRLFLNKKQNSNINELYDYAIKLFLSDDRIHINSNIENGSKFIINLSAPNYKVETILNYLNNQDIYFSTKSACSTSQKSSRIMEALDIDKSMKNSSFRISFSLDSTKEEVDIFFKALVQSLDTLKKG